MDPLLQYLLKNKEWIFSGVGVFILAGAIHIAKRVLPARSAVSFEESAQKSSDRDETPSYRTNNVTFSDGVVGIVEAHLVYRVVDAIRYTYESTKPMDILLPLVDSRLRQMLEQMSISEARSRREIIGTALIEALQPEFARYGMELGSVLIGSISSKHKNGGNVGGGGA